jgi:YVTN family beta-propeller protein
MSRIFGSNTVSVIDTATSTVVWTVPVGEHPRGVAVTPDGRHAYVANVGSNTVSVIDTATSTVVGAPVPVGNGPTGVAIGDCRQGCEPDNSDCLGNCQADFASCPFETQESHQQCLEVFEACNKSCREEHAKCLANCK